MEDITPIPAAIVDEVYTKSGLSVLSKASIREMGKLVNEIEARSGKKFIHMERGVPGPPPLNRCRCEIKSLSEGVASIYQI